MHAGPLPASIRLIGAARNELLGLDGLDRPAGLNTVGILSARQYPTVWPTVSGALSEASPLVISDSYILSEMLSAMISGT